MKRIIVTLATLTLGFALTGCSWGKDKDDAEPPLAYLPTQTTPEQEEPPVGDDSVGTPGKETPTPPQQEQWSTVDPQATQFTTVEGQKIELPEGYTFASWEKEAQAAVDVAHKFLEQKYAVVPQDTSPLAWVERSAPFATKAYLDQYRGMGASVSDKEAWELERKNRGTREFMATGMDSIDYTQEFTSTKLHVTVSGTTVSRQNGDIVFADEESVFPLTMIKEGGTWKVAQD